MKVNKFFLGFTKNKNSIFIGMKQGNKGNISRTVVKQLSFNK